MKKTMKHRVRLKIKTASEILIIAPRLLKREEEELQLIDEDGFDVSLFDYAI